MWHAAPLELSVAVVKNSQRRVALLYLERRAELDFLKGQRAVDVRWLLGHTVQQIYFRTRRANLKTRVSIFREVQNTPV